MHNLNAQISKKIDTPKIVSNNPTFAIILVLILALFATGCESDLQIISGNTKNMTAGEQKIPPLLEHMERQSFPTNMSSYEYMKTVMKPAWENRSRTLTQRDLSGHITFSCYDVLALPAKNVLLRIFGADSLEGMNASYQKAMRFAQQNNGSTVGGLHTLQIRQLERMQRCEEGKGFLFVDDKIDIGLVLIPFANKDVRAYSLREGKLWDKSYVQLYEQTQRINNTAYFTTLMSTIKYGFYMPRLTTLSLDEQEILIDTLGIYLSEYFKASKRNRVEESFSGLSTVAISIMCAYTHSGGKIIAFASETNFSQSTLAVKEEHCVYLEENFYYKRKLLGLNDQVISRYIRENHPDLYARFLGRFQIREDQLIYALSLDLKDDQQQDFAQKEAYERDIKLLLEILTQESTLISQYMNTYEQLQLSPRSMYYFNGRIDTV